MCVCIFNYRIILIKVHNCLDQVFKKKKSTLCPPAPSRLCSQTPLETDRGSELEPGTLYGAAVPCSLCWLPLTSTGPRLGGGADSWAGVGEPKTRVTPSSVLPTAQALPLGATAGPETGEEEGGVCEHLRNERSQVRAPTPPHQTSAGHDGPADNRGHNQTRGL